MGSNLEPEPVETAAMSDIAAAVSAPLKVIVSRATMIRSGTGDPDEHTRVIAARVAEINALVHKTLATLARTLAGAPGETDLAQLIRHIARRLPP